MTRNECEALVLKHGGRAEAAAAIGEKRTTFIERCKRLGVGTVVNSSSPAYIPLPVDSKVTIEIIRTRDEMALRMVVE